MARLSRALEGVSRREAALAGALVVLGLGETVLRGLEPRLPLLLLSLLVPLPLLWRLRFPLEVLGGSVAALLVGQVVAQRQDFPVSLGCAGLVATYSAAAHLRGRRADTADFLVVAAIVGSAAVVALKTWDSSTATNVVAALISLTILFRGAWTAGRWVQGRRDRERAVMAEREANARAALGEERARIARELHDIVAHAMSVIVLQARGVRHSLLDRPAEAREAIDAVERTASQALVETRRLLGVLREDDESAALTPQPSLGQVDALVAQVRAAGLAVELRIEGARRELPAGIELCAYRVVQESLTNTLRHAGPATARVLLRYADDALEVQVTDTGAGRGANGGAAGRGLAGMRERVALFGGALDAGPQRESGYAVTARLPL